MSFNIGDRVEIKNYEPTGWGGTLLTGTVAEDATALMSVKLAAKQNYYGIKLDDYSFTYNAIFAASNLRRIV